MCEGRAIDECVTQDCKNVSQMNVALKYIGKFPNRTLYLQNVPTGH